MVFLPETQLKLPFVLIQSHFFCENPCLSTSLCRWYLPFKHVWIVITTYFHVPGPVF